MSIKSDIVLKRGIYIFACFLFSCTGCIFPQKNIITDEPVYEGNIEYQPDKTEKITLRREIVVTAKSYIGIPYKYGGTNKAGIDCSGLVYTVFSKYGINLPRRSSEQYMAGKPIEKYQLEPADLVFFNTYKPGASHVGIYLGSGKFVHASSGSKKVKIDKLTNSYFKRHYFGACRILK